MGSSPTLTTPWDGPTRLSCCASQVAPRCSSFSASLKSDQKSRCSGSSCSRIRAFTAGVFASFLAALSRGGLMFMLIIWLQGIWLPLHGYDFARTPLWAGLAMLPLTAGFLVSGPFSGMLSDRFGARPFATGGMVGTAICFGLLELLPTDFSYWVFALLLFATGLTMSMFGSPNRAGVMNSLPPEHRARGRE